LIPLTFFLHFKYFARLQKIEKIGAQIQRFQLFSNWLTLWLVKFAGYVGNRNKAAGRLSG
jgi:hypothetical protein